MIPRELLPLGEIDKKALLAGVIDGTLDCIATDHAPHTADEKSRGLSGSAMGVVGLETAFAASLSALHGLVPLERILTMLDAAPRRIANRSWGDRKSPRLNACHIQKTRMPASA